MTTYTVLASRDGSGFDIAIINYNGTRQTMLGFKTEAEAAEWITNTQRVDALHTPHADRAISKS